MTDFLDPIILNFVYAGLGGLLTIWFMKLGCSTFNKIVSFNIGVELGQIAALIPIIFVITNWKTRKSYDAFYKATNTYLIIAGIGLFIFQLYGYFNGH